MYNNYDNDILDNTSISNTNNHVYTNNCIYMGNNHNNMDNNHNNMVNPTPNTMNLKTMDHKQDPNIKMDMDDEIYISSLYKKDHYKLLV